MYRFILHNRKLIDEEYLRLFSHASWNRKAKKFDAIVKKYSVLSFLNEVKYKDLFIMPFDKLVDVYYEYTAAEKDLSEKDVMALHKCFPYANHSDDKIIPFIEKHTQHAESTTCPYCDCKSIHVFQRPDTRRNYHLDHFLDKGKCSLVALSLHNLIPVCSDCNTEKGANTFGNDKASTKFLSPFNPKYDFENEVPFTVSPLEKKEILKIRSRENLKKYVISMDFEKSPLYEQEVVITKVEKRFYSDVTSNEHSAMMEIFWNIVEKRQSYSRLDAKDCSKKLLSDFLLPSETQHQNGIRRLYDKFIRDTIRLYTR